MTATISPETTVSLSKVKITKAGSSLISRKFREGPRTWKSRSRNSSFCLLPFNRSVGFSYSVRFLSVALCWYLCEFCWTLSGLGSTSLGILCLF